jgi:hypothetical protein
MNTVIFGNNVTSESTTTPSPSKLLQSGFSTFQLRIQLISINIKPQILASPLISTTHGTAGRSTARDIHGEATHSQHTQISTLPHSHATTE